MNKENNGAGLRPCQCRRCQQDPAGPTAEQHRSINRLVALADERSRRLLAGFLAEQHGRGGIALLSQITGLDRNTIARGLRELHGEQPLPPGRIRQPGAGRKPVEVAVPGS
jgi:methylphosphotriester-DNA--protein-cysteine methyltransferase